MIEGTYMSNESSGLSSTGNRSSRQFQSLLIGIKFKNFMSKNM